MPTVSFKTIGCRLNQAETAQMAAQFEAVGYRIVDADGPCDVAVVNTCTITHGAERDSAKWARRLRRGGAERVILAGCAVEHGGEQLGVDAGVDLIANQEDKFRLIELLHGPAGIAPKPSLVTEDASQPHTPLFSATRALVKAQDGCNFRCSYCIVPDARGKPRSRSLNEVILDVRGLAESGYKEIVVTGANLGCYRDGNNGLIELLQSVDAVDGIERVRISSIESTTVEREVVDYMAVSSKLCRFLHLPLQSGDNDTLQRMGRRYTVDAYRTVVEHAVRMLPDVGLGTDIIVGFPGETDAEFANTLDFVATLPFSNLHVFSYSPRRGTPAADMPNQVAPEVKKIRSAQLIELGARKRQAFASAFVGRATSMLVERIDDDGVAAGWTDQYLPARFHGTTDVNEIVTFHPEHIEGDVLVGSARL